MSSHTTISRPRRAVALTAIALVAGVAVAQAQSGSPEPSADAPIGWLGAVQEVYRDDFSTPTTWTIANDELGRSAYEDGGLSLLMTQDDSKVWDDHLLPESHAVLRVEALVSGLDGAGGAGVACGSSLGLQRYLFAAVNQEAEWVFGRIIDGRLQVIDRGPIPGDIDEHHVRVGNRVRQRARGGRRPRPGDAGRTGLDAAGVRHPGRSVRQGHPSGDLRPGAGIGPLRRLRRARRGRLRTTRARSGP